MADPYEEEDFDEEGEAALAEMMEQVESRMPLSQFPVGPSSSTGHPAYSGLSGQRAGAGGEARAGKCVDCNESDGQHKFFDAFGVSACYDCQRASKGPGGKYQVITKSKAKDEYLLTERQLSQKEGGLGCMTMPNPRDNRYGDMRLYLRVQVEELALQTWGSDEALFVEKERRVQERTQKAEARKRKATTEGSGPRGRKPSDGKKRPPAGPPPSIVSHVHVFLPDETYDEEEDTWTKRCECGFEVTYEKI